MASCLAGLFFSTLVPPAVAQEKSSAPPQLVSYWGAAAGLDGKPRTGTAGVTFSIYREQLGGTPLWMETQNVALDSNGGYNAQIGATNPEGLPIGLFSSGEARWLEVQVDGQPPAQRVLLVSVPYALKAVDAQTLGGLPASAFALAGTTATTAPGAHASVASAAPPASPGGKANTAQTGTDITGSGTAGYLPVFTAASTIADSVIVQKSGDVGVGVTPSSTVKLSVSNSAGDGIEGISSSTSGAGVEGSATATTGTTYGVFGLNASSTGTGVAGQATAANGITTGVVGISASSQGAGVSGTVTATTGSPYGVYGSSASSNGYGIFGTNTATTGYATAVYGTSASGVGVWGNSTAPSGYAYGVYGAASSPNGFGVYGNASSATGTTYGVAGYTSSPNGVGTLGYSYATSGGTTGVEGLVSSTSGTAVYGDSTATTGSTYGVYGTVASTSGVGVYGSSTASSGKTYGVEGVTYSSAGAGIYGETLASSGTSLGILGQASGDTNIGVAGTQLIYSTIGGEVMANGEGLWGDTYVGNVGVLATADDAEALAAYNSATNVATMFVENQTDASSNAIVLATYSDYGGFCDIFVNGNLSCSGSVGGHAVIDQTHEVALYSVQAADNWMEDAGSGQLHGGIATVTLDAAYAQTVNTTVDYHVFLTPNGDCKGLYVTQKSPTSFEVHELGGGTSSIAFDYRIMARRKGYEDVRLADLTGKIQKDTLKHNKGAKPVSPGSHRDELPQHQLPVPHPLPQVPPSR
jgi:hypothetical protein